MKSLRKCVCKHTSQSGSIWNILEHFINHFQIIVKHLGRDKYYIYHYFVRQLQMCFNICCPLQGRLVYQLVGLGF